MIRKLDVENLTYAFPEVAFDNDYVIATYQAKVQTKNIEKMCIRDSRYPIHAVAAAAAGFAAAGSHCRQYQPLPA